MADRKRVVRALCERTRETRDEPRSSVCGPASCRKRPAPQTAGRAGRPGSGSDCCSPSVTHVRRRQRLTHRGADAPALKLSHFEENSRSIGTWVAKTFQVSSPKSSVCRGFLLALLWGVCGCHAGRRFCGFRHALRAYAVLPESFRWPAGPMPRDRPMGAG